MEVVCGHTRPSKDRENPIRKPENWLTSQSVIDLWHGHILSQDGALQLLLIIDTICDWARDVYRPGILRCLAGSIERLRQLTPADTLISMDDGDEGLEEATSPLQWRMQTTGLVLHNGRSPPEDAGDAMVLEPEELHTLQSGRSCSIPGMGVCIEESSSERSSMDASTTEITIRKADRPILQWRQLRLPSENEEMVSFLQIVKPETDIRQAAFELLSIFLDDRLAVTSTSHWVSFLENSIPCPPRQRREEQEAAVRVVLHCSSFVDRSSWAIIQQLTCLICTVNAASTLAMIARDTSMALSVFHWRPHDCSCIAERWQDLQNLRGRPATIAALSDLSIALQHQPEKGDMGHLEWVPCDGDHWQVLEKWDIDAVLERLQATPGASADILQLLQVTLKAEMNHYTNSTHALIDTSGVDGVPGLLVKKPPEWSDECSAWCFVLFDESERRGERVWQLAAETLRRKAFYTSRTENGRIGQADRLFLEQWIERRAATEEE